MSKKAIVKDESKEVSMQSALLAVVQNPDIDPARLKEFLDLQIQMENRQAKSDFKKALSGFQSECPIIPRNKSVEFGNTKYDYSPLENIVFLIKPILQKWGLSYSFDIENTDDKEQNKLVTIINHSGGHSEKFRYFFNPVSDNTKMSINQRTKSSSTFAKRVGLENALGIVNAGEDNDCVSDTAAVMLPSQLDQINLLVEQTNTDVPKLLSYLKIESLDSMNGSQAKKALHALNQKKKVKNV